MTQGLTPTLPDITGDVDPDGDRFRLSPTSIAAYLQDPAMYYFSRVMRMPQPANLNMSIGSAVHAALEYALKTVMKEGVLPPITECLDYARGIWQEKVVGIPPDPGKPHEQHWLHLQNQLVPVAYESLIGIEPAAVESHVTREVPGELLDIHGYIDLTHVDGTICDFKTAARSPSKDKVTGEFKITNIHRLQLTYYAWIMSGGEHEVPVEIRTIVKTKYAKMVKSTTIITPKEMENRVRTARIVYEGIMNKAFFPNYGHWRCSESQCPFWHTCMETF